MYTSVHVCSIHAVHIYGPCSRTVNTGSAYGMDGKERERERDREQLDEVYELTCVECIVYRFVAGVSIVRVYVTNDIVQDCCDFVTVSGASLRL